MAFFLLRKKDESGARGSALAISAVYLSFFVSSIICFTTLYEENQIMAFLREVDNLSYCSMTSYIVSYLLLYLRYDKRRSVDDIEKEYLDEKKIVRYVYKTIIYTLEVLIPVILYIAGRLALHGHL
jgi:hypothetical protein